MKLKTFINNLPIASAIRPMYKYSTINPTTSNEVIEFLRLCAMLIGIAPNQLMDWEITDLIKKLHDLEDDLINYQYLSDMESLLMQGASASRDALH